MLFRYRGFTLIELMLALAISVILISIGYPSYVSYQIHAERNRAEVALLQLSADMEAYFSDHDSYEDASLKNLHATHLVDGLDYQLCIVKATGAHYEVQAVPTGVQAVRDIACRILSLTDANNHAISGDGDADACWR